MELVTIVQNGGPYVVAMIMTYLYLSERNDRKEAEKSLNGVYTEYVERLITAVNATSQATRDITTTMTTLNSTFQTILYRIRDPGVGDGK